MSTENKMPIRRVTIEDISGGTTIYTKVVDIDFLPVGNLELMTVAFVDTDGTPKTAVQLLTNIFRYIVEPYREKETKMYDNGEENL